MTTHPAPGPAPATGAGSRHDYLTAGEAAALAGVEPDTFTTYVHRGQAPRPDVDIPRHRLWERSTVETWIRSRPGRGRWGRRDG